MYITYKKYNMKLIFVQSNGLGGVMRLTEEDKKLIEYLYIRGFDASSIQKRLSKRHNIDTIRRYIQRNLKEYKDIHDSNYKYNKEILRKTKWECSQEIGNVAFGKVNRSIYKVAANGDLVVNKKVAPIVTFDTPNRIKMV